MTSNLQFSVINFNSNSTNQAIYTSGFACGVLSISKNMNTFFFIHKSSWVYNDNHTLHINLYSSEQTF